MTHRAKRTSQVLRRIAICLVAVVMLPAAGWPSLHARASGHEENVERSLALGSGDYDEDGVPDLVCGYARRGGSSSRSL